jgi:hypothetical protein
LATPQHVVVDVEGLVDVVPGAQLDGRDRVLDRREAGHEDHEHVGILLLDRAQQRQPVAVGQLEVEQDQVDPVAQALARGGHAVRLEDGVALALEAIAQREADQRLVVDDQDRRGGHGREHITTAARSRRRGTVFAQAAGESLLAENPPWTCRGS